MKTTSYCQSSHEKATIFCLKSVPVPSDDPEKKFDGMLSGLSHTNSICPWTMALLRTSRGFPGGGLLQVVFGVVASTNPTIVKKDFLSSAAEDKTVAITGPCLPGFERRSASRFHLAFSTWLHSCSDVTRVLPSSGES